MTEKYSQAWEKRWGKVKLSGDSEGRLRRRKMGTTLGGWRGIFFRRRSRDGKETGGSIQILDRNNRAIRRETLPMNYMRRESPKWKSIMRRISEGRLILDEKFRRGTGIQKRNSLDGRGLNMRKEAAKKDELRKGKKCCTDEGGGKNFSRGIRD